MSLVESTFNQNTKLWCIAQNSTKLCHRLFSEGVSKQLDQRKLEDIQKNLCCGVPLKYKSTNTVYQYFSESAQKEKDALKFENSKKIFAKLFLFPLTLQACNPQFLTSAKTDSKKNVFFECSEIVGSLPGKDL